MSADGYDIVLDIQDVHHWFGNGQHRHNVLHDLNIKIVPGEIVSLVGPSGCGKSTLLRSIVGTHPPSRGNVIIYPEAGHEAGIVIKKPSRRIGIVYQHYSLFPFLTAQENVAIGLMFRDSSIEDRLFSYFRWQDIRKQHMEAAAEQLEKLGLLPAMKRYPAEMSGGMRQRVAIAQVLIMKPEIMLLDEPFGALDEATREELQKILLTLYMENCQAKKLGERPPYTIMIVTHELNEAIYVGDRVIGLTQYWDWKEKGIEQYPGATIVYDKMAPVYEPEQARDFEKFRAQREAIRRAVFDPAYCQRVEEFRLFWKQMADGEGTGVLYGQST